MNRSHKPVDVEIKVEKLPSGTKGYKVNGHELRLGQVVTNLIENARSFVPAENGRIIVRLSRTARRVTIAIEDNGPGIRPDALERIFERFYTDRPQEDAFGQNSGLGLSISRQIVEAHGGTLKAENIVGAKPGDIRGARFVITLPAET
jgi:two-component system sensor histidine kinase ChvG